MGAARRRFVFAAWAAGWVTIAVGCGEQLGAPESPDAEAPDAGGADGEGTPSDASLDTNEGGLGLLENGPPSKVVQIVAGTSVCAFNQGVSVCTGSNDSHTCALRNDRTVWCWGSDRWGRLGFVATDEAQARIGVPVFAPRRVDDLLKKPVRALAAGADHTCALLDDGQVHCWGYNWNGQLGISAGAETASDGSAGKGQRPSLAAFFTIEGPALVAAGVEAGQGATCARDATGRVVCVGKANDQDTAAFGGTPFVQLSMGWKTSCGRTRTNGLYCSGDNASGQVQAGGPLQASQTLVADTDVLDVRVGYGHICARIGTGTSCWGNGLAFGGPGNLSFAARQAIGAGGGGAAITRFEAGGSHTCWVELGQVSCAGSGGAIPVGVISSAVGSLQDVRDLALSQTHACALTIAGQVYCFGANSYGELGQDPAVTPSSSKALLVTIPE